MAHPTDDCPSRLLEAIERPVAPLERFPDVEVARIVVLLACTAFALGASVVAASFGLALLVGRLPWPGAA